MAKNKRGKGEGTVYQRTDGTWSAVLTVGYNEAGKRNRKTVYGKTKKEVTDKLTRLQSQKLDGTLIESKRMTVGDLLDTWLNDVARLDVSPTTFHRYKGLVTNHIKPTIGSTKLSLLKAINVQSMLSKLEENGAGAETRRYSFQVLKRAFNIGVDMEVMLRNPCGRIANPKVVRRAIHPLTVEQVQKLLSVTIGDIDPDAKDSEKLKPVRNHAVFAVAITTGLRQGEIFAIQWADVDLKSGQLSVRYNLEEVQGRLRLKEPKSKSGRRQIKLSPMAIEALRIQRERQEAEGLKDCKTVFCDENGGFLRKSNFERNVWKRCRAAAGIPATVVFHDLRHTSATLLLSAGTNPKVVQERLGHSKIALTMDTYSHVMPGMQDQAANQMETILTVKPKRKRKAV